MGVILLLIVVATAAIVSSRGGGGGSRDEARAPGTPMGVRSESALCGPPKCRRFSPSVTISWAPPSTGGAVTGYEVLRSTTVVDELAGDASSYEFEGLSIGEESVLGVRAIGPGGNGPIEQLAVRAPVPRLKDAQLAGSYEVKVTVRSVTAGSTILGFEHPKRGDRQIGTWMFTTTCPDDTGACPVKWFGHGPLPVHGTTYAGHVASQPAKCGDVFRTPSTATFHIEVDRGEVYLGHWVAGKIHGTLEIRFTCLGGPPAVGSFTFTGTRF